MFDLNFSHFPQHEWSFSFFAAHSVPFHQVIAVNYSPRAQTLLIHCSVGSIVLTGPQAEAFLEQFCEHKVALVKAYGKDILRVSLAH